ncbi:uncharacterized protein LOC110620392 [Manihot esculenta]|uniref:EF-hand domain-containing protein n=1 Tax=Manihot esculenta TaxID=3983 RepID=A0A2C9VG17_MANES|nr:uncharacterized protein LOC110620392 [Manihot esculenta]OAY44237.1 hypothetical protein MANES_08G134300v8 [Manihot esculenta]
MSEGGMTVLDGTQLRSLQVSLPVSDVTLTGAKLLDFADSISSDSLFGLSLPQCLKSSALRRVNVYDDVSFRRSELTKEAATSKLNDYLTAIADELKDNPLVVSILDGNTLRLFLEDEDDFAMLAENIFTDLDIEDKGKITKAEMRNALVHMGVEMGVPPFEEFPLLNDILKKHGAEGEVELGQLQFAELLQPILQEIAETLAQKPVAVIHNTEIVNGCKIRKLLTDEKQLNDVAEKILQEKRSKKDYQNNTEIIRRFLEANGKELGLPPSEANEAVVLLYDAVFADVQSGKCAAESEEVFRELVKEILEKFAEQLEANPIYCDLDN